MLKYFLIIVVSLLPLYSQYDVARIRSPYLNEFKELEVGPNDMLWAGTWGDGVRRSTDLADTWEVKNNGLGDLYISDLNFKDGILLAGTYGGGVYKSTNEGNGWEEINNGLFNLRVVGVAVKDDSTYFAATEGNGVFRTTDGGLTWEEKNKGNNFQDMRFVHITPAGNILAGKQGDGLIRSDDNGENWKTSSSGIFNKYVISIQNLPNDEIWVSSAGEGIFQSSSDGNHWLRIDLLDNLIERNIESFTYFEHENSYYQIVGTRNWGIWRFDANWHTPKFEPTVIVNRTAHSMVTLSTGRIVVAIGSRGIAYSDNMGEKFSYPSGLREGTDNDYLVETDGKNVLVALGGGGIFHSSNYGYAWEDRGEEHSEYGFLKKQGDKIFYSALNTLKYTTNHGQNWTTVNVTDLYPNATDYEKLFRYTGIVHNGNNIYLTHSVDYRYTGTSMEPPPPPTVEYSILVSNDNGGSWSLANDIASDVPVFDLTRTSNGNLFALNEIGVIYRSTNQGTNWEVAQATPNSENTRYKFIKANGNRLYISGNRSLEESIDNAQTLTRVNFDFDQMNFVGFTPREDVQDLVFTGPSNFFAGFNSNFGVYKSDNNGVDVDSINNSYPTERVRSMASNTDRDVYIATSSIWRYVDERGLPIPVLVSPANNTTNMSIVPEDPDGRPAALIEWEETEKADIYEIQVSEYEEFFNFMYKKVHAGTTAVLEDSLKYNTTYYWRVRSKVNDSYGRWSSRWSFTTELPSPKLISPEDNKIGVPINPTYTWESIPNTENYLIEVSTSLEFQDIVFSQTVTSSTFESGTYTHNELLTPSTTYYWRMKAMSDKSESRWSEYNQFTTVTGAPTLIYPEANQSEIPTEVVFKFKGVEETDVYRIQVSSDSTFKELALLILNRNTETDSTHFFDFLEFFKVYYWRVQSVLVVKNDQGVDVEYYGVWSEIRKFTTGIQPPGLLSPPNNTFDVSLTPNLQWDSFDGAVGYHVQLGKTSNFEEELIINDTINELSYQVPDGLLSNYELYYWRMRVILADNAASWVSPWRFTTIMQKSSAVNPNCGAVDMPLEFTLVWELVTGADNYRLEVSSNENFVSENIVFSKEDLSSDRIKIEEVLEEGKTYYWRTQGYNENNTGPWSEVCSFTTQMLSVRNIEKEFNFIAYPNPTKDEMKYEFTLEKASKVEIEIYDMTGLKIATLIDRPLSSGLHQINWEVGSISNGNYNLIMTVNGKSYLKLVGVSK